MKIIDLPVLDYQYWVVNAIKNQQSSTRFSILRHCVWIRQNDVGLGSVKFRDYS